MYNFNLISQIFQGDDMPQVEVLPATGQKSLVESYFSLILLIIY